MPKVSRFLQPFQFSMSVFTGNQDTLENQGYCRQTVLIVRMQRSSFILPSPFPAISPLYLSALSDAPFQPLFLLLPVLSA